MIPCKEIKKLEVQYGNEKICFDLIFNQGKRIVISVYPDLRVVVKAPLYRTADEVKDRVKRSASWILRQKAHFLRFHPFQPPRRYVSGETHYYLGRQYRLKIMEDIRKKVKLKGKYFHVFTPDKKNREAIKRQLDQWRRNHAKSIFAIHVQKCYEKTKRYNIPFPEFAIRKMKRRWGSFTKKGKILLNTELMKVPLYCMDYVIMHELCHTMFPHHNVKFYHMMNRCLPDWERRKERLEYISFVLP